MKVQYVEYIATDCSVESTRAPLPKWRSLAAPSPGTLGRRCPSSKTTFVSFQSFGGVVLAEEPPFCHSDDYSNLGVAKTSPVGAKFLELDVSVSSIKWPLQLESKCLGWSEGGLEVGEHLQEEVCQAETCGEVFPQNFPQISLIRLRTSWQARTRRSPGRLKTLGVRSCRTYHHSPRSKNVNFPKLAKRIEKSS